MTTDIRTDVSEKRPYLPEAERGWALQDKAPTGTATSGGSALRLVGLDLDDVVRGGFALAGGAHANVAGALMEGGEI